MIQSPGDSPFPTMVVGSLPRPRWVRDLIEDRKAGQIAEADAGTLLDDAVPLAIRLQERAGLDFISDGEWRRESYIKVFAEAVDGFRHDLVDSGGSGLMYPAVVAELSQRRPIALDEAHFLKDRTSHKTIVAVPSPYTIGRRMWSAQHSAAAYETPEALMEACIPIVRDEIRDLIAAGVDAVQLDDPWLALLVDPQWRDSEGITDVDHEIETCVRCVNETVAGIEGAYISVHLCHAHFDRHHSTTGPYDLIIDALGEMDVDRFAMELASTSAPSAPSARPPSSTCARWFRPRRTMATTLC